MKKIRDLLLGLLAACLLLPMTLVPAHAADLDYIEDYQITVSPDDTDGSLMFLVDLKWTVLDEGPVSWLKIGVPNGSIRDAVPLTDNIDYLEYDNSYMYVYFKENYYDGETFSFSYGWTQEYMYTLSDSGAVSYDYTPGWFDEAEIGHMQLTWYNPEGLMPDYELSASCDGAQSRQEGDALVMEAWDLGHGDIMNIRATYDSWPTELTWENSAENMPQDTYYDYARSQMIAKFITVAFVFVVVFLFVAIGARRDGYAGGFGTRYVFVNHLWYPAGPDGRPRPGSRGTKHKPSPPRGGGFGGGRRGGGFGGGGFGGGSHCACASSCACACACACAGGGRAGCSAKNLYGAVHLSRKVTEQLEAR